MPARVHALLVVRSDADPWHLERTLDALTAQERRPDALTIVLCGTGSTEIQTLIAGSGAEGVITSPRHTSFAHALRLATHRLRTHAAPPAQATNAPTDAVWLLAHDTTPEPDALRRLAGALETQSSATIVAPKLVERTDPGGIVSLGVTMTRFGRAVQLVDGHLDQGQYDHLEDALGADIRGMLVRRATWDTLHGIDPALAGADEGLDLAVRARLAGDRIALVPAARLAVSSPLTARTSARPSARASARTSARASARTSARPASTPDAPTDYAARTAQLQRRLAYAPALAVPVHWLSMPLLALLRSILHLIRKEPGSVLAEWAAAATVMVRWGAIARSRGRIRSAAKTTGTKIPWSQLAPLRITRAQLHQRLDGPDGRQEPPPTRGDLHFFIGGGAWTVLAALVVGFGIFIPLLTWPSIGGGGLLPLRDSLVGLWTDAGYGRRALGLDTVGPADPFAAVVAVFGSVTPWNPSQAFVILWLLSLPLAALGGWFAATRLTARPGLRITGAVLWTLAPMFVTALVQGRPGAVIIHLLLPWLFYTATAARRSWASAGAASLLTAAVSACSPSLLPALLLLWIVALFFSRGGVGRIIWLPIPTLALFGPLLWERGVLGRDWWGVFADPGVVFAAAQNGTDAATRALLVAGLPTPDLAGWVALTPWGTWAWVLSVPLGIAVVCAFFTTRWRAVLSLTAVLVLGLATAMGAAMIAVQSDGPVIVPLWPGAALSIAWLAAVAAALIALDAPVHRRIRGVAPVGATLVALSVAALAAPALISPLAGEGAGSLVRNGPTTTLPAYVAAAGQSNPDLGTLVITPLAEGELAVTLVWGASETLGGTSTIVSTRSTPTAGDEELAAIAADLVSPGAPDATPRLAAAGVGFVLLAPAAASSSELESQGKAAMDARGTLESVGDTSRGSLWRVRDGVAPRADVTAPVANTARNIAITQLAVFGIAVLLAVPTLASRRAARGYPRQLDVRPEADTLLVRPRAGGAGADGADADGADAGGPDAGAVDAGESRIGDGAGSPDRSARTKAAAAGAASAPGSGAGSAGPAVSAAEGSATATAHGAVTRRPMDDLRTTDPRSKSSGDAHAQAHEARGTDSNINSSGDAGAGPGADAHDARVTGLTAGVPASTRPSPDVTVSDGDGIARETDPDLDPSANPDFEEVDAVEPAPELVGEQASVVIDPRDGLFQAEDLVDPEASGGERDDPWEERP